MTRAVPLRSPAPPPLAQRRKGWSAGRLALAFVLFQIACQLSLAFGFAGSARAMVRMAVFGSSAALFIFLRGRGKLHPATMPASFALLAVGLGLLHPTTNGFAAGLAHLSMYVLIVLPLFWACRQRIHLSELKTALLVFWGFHTISALFGVLQVYFPGRFQPAISSVITSSGKGYFGTLYITTASGARVLRPMGLTDQPGGAAMAGYYAALFGLGFYLSASNKLIRAAGVASMAAGLLCLYLSQVRSVLVMLGVSIVGLLFLLASHGRVGRLVNLVSATGAIAAISLGLALQVAPDAVSKRLGTLTEGDPADVYYRNRGIFLEQTVNELLPEYPMGAGLGRWGMMNYYFGDNTNPESYPIWVEIQWTGWLLDGGIPLILSYVAALGMAALVAMRVAGNRTHPELWLWGALIFGYNLGCIALTFNYPIFMSQTGLEFWLLNGLLFAAAQTAAARPRPVVLPTIKRETVFAGRR
jgi:hypothetical protein